MYSEETGFERLFGLGLGARERCRRRERRQATLGGG